MTIIYLYEGGFRAVLDRMNGILRFSREVGRMDIGCYECLSGGLTIQIR